MARLIGTASSHGIGIRTVPSWYARTFVTSEDGLKYAEHYDVDIKNGSTIAAGYINSNSTTHPMLTYRNSAGTVQWQKKIVNNYPWGGCRFDSSGNVLASGWSSSGYSSLIKINAAGTSILWQKSMTIGGYSPQSTGTNVVEVDSSDNVYLAGGFGYAISYQMGGVIAKFNSSGTIQWQRRLTDSGSSRTTVQRLAVDSSGNVYGVGYYGNNASNNSHFSPFVVKYNSSGTIQWQRFIVPQKANASSQLKGAGIAVDSSGNVYIAGSVFETAGGEYAYLAKFNSSGAFQWIRKLQESTYQSWATDVKVGSDGTVYTLGVNFQWNASSPSSFLARHDSSGTLISANRMRWSGSYDSTGTRQNTIRLDAANSKALICGTYSRNETSFDPEVGYTWRKDIANLLYVPLNGAPEDTFTPTYETMNTLTSSDYSSITSSTTGNLTDQVGGYTVSDSSLTLTDHSVGITNTYNG